LDGERKSSFYQHPPFPFNAAKLAKLPEDNIHIHEKMVGWKFWASAWKGTHTDAGCRNRMARRCSVKMTWSREEDRRMIIRDRCRSVSRKGGTVRDGKVAGATTWSIVSNRLRHVAGG